MVDPESDMKTSHLQIHKFETTDQKKRGVGREGTYIANVQMPTIKSRIYCGELVSSELYTCKQGTINPVQETRGMRSMLTLFNQTFPVTAKAIQCT